MSAFISMVGKSIRKGAFHKKNSMKVNLSYFTSSKGSKREVFGVVPLCKNGEKL